MIYVNVKNIKTLSTLFLLIYMYKSSQSLFYSFVFRSNFCLQSKDEMLYLIIAQLKCFEEIVRQALRLNNNTLHDLNNIVVEK